MSSFLKKESHLSRGNINKNDVLMAVKVKQYKLKINLV